MIMRFNLEHQIVVVVEPDDASIVLEDADARIVLAALLPGGADLLSGSKNRLLEHIFERARLRSPARGASRADRAGISDSPSERSVAAVLAPGLSERFQLGVGGVAAKVAEMRLYCLHFGQRQEELTFAAQLFQAGIVHAA